jgi:hypothetical protein
MSAWPTADQSQKSTAARPCVETLPEHTMKSENKSSIRFDADEDAIRYIHHAPV